MLKKPETASKLDQAIRISLIVYQALAIVAFILYPILAYLYFNTPFMGVFMDTTMISNGVHPSPVPEYWGATSQGVQFKDQLQSIDGIPATSYMQVREILRDRFAGEEIQADFKSESGETKTYNITLSRFGTSDQISYFYLPFFVGVVYFVVSWWIFGLRRSEMAGRSFVAFSTSAAISAGGLLDIYTTHWMSFLWNFALPLCGAALLDLAMVFPQEARIIRRYPWVRLLGYLVAFGLAINSGLMLYAVQDPYRFIQGWAYSYIFDGLAIIFFLAMMFYRRFGAQSPVVRQQSGTILIGTLVGFGPIALWFLSNIFASQNFNTGILLFIIVFPLTTGYTVQRARLLHTDYLVSQGILYGLLILLATTGYLLLTAGLGLIFGSLFGSALPFNSPLSIGIMVGLLVLLTDPVRMRLKQYIDNLFFRGQKAYDERLQNFSRELTNAVALPDVLRALREQVKTSLLPARMHIYIYDAGNDQYAATNDETNRPSSDITFSRNSALVKQLNAEHLPFFFDQSHPIRAFESESARITLTGATLFVAMPGRDRLVGWIALGERMSGQVYSTSDLRFLESLCDQAAVAIERAQIVSNMERRVQEMNVLSRVAQGINITLRFDDILELIYAQASQVVPCSDFHITLYNKTGQYYYYAFYLENDERIMRRENTALPPKTSLAQEVAMLRRPLISTDHLRECQIYSVTPTTEGLYAWAGVPLNAGIETLGVLSLASRDPGVLYTPRQIELLQNIADQAAGAIVKARLLDETEKRARQLATLNQLTRQITSTLETEPLLKNLLESAVTILNTEAGSLFLVDEQTDELVFRVTVGSVASNLVGQRLPSGSGVVGRVVTTREPVIVNEAQASPQWDASSDKQTGFVTRAILAVPLEVKERVIGVLEVINKKDGLPFTMEDQNLLAAFGGQAAVAIDNARLYTLTDQELTARVEELSVMQRIDRELNASLEIDRAMRITLEWAMRQSGAEAGLIGILRDKGVQLMAHQGYGATLDEYQQALISLEHPAIIDVLTTAQPRLVKLGENEQEKAFLQNASSQFVIPIRREAQVIGLFLLESSRVEQFSDQAQGFLSRLSDHAAIAIANAQLYAQIDSANRAKSQFVSFVAHELKNPMASIKGYTELVAGGMAGPINEMQSKFLFTVRSNVDRMNTIVSDLNDINKIEAGVLKLEYKKVEVAEVLEESVRSLRKQIEEKEQVIETLVPDTLPLVWADRNRMIQILVNLVSNATKYTPKGGKISIGADLSQGEGRGSENLQLVHCWVQDTGIGINPEDQKKVFTQYFRTEYSKEMATGTGLGLNITKNLVEMQGGRIWFDSELGKGTTFHFTVPVSES